MQSLSTPQSQLLPTKQVDGSTAQTDEQLLAVSLSDPRIRDKTDQDLKEYLAFAFALIGLSKFPDPMEEIILLSFIREQFGGHRLPEIKLAFTMGVCGKLDVDMRHFQCFSPEYFGRVMTAYRSWASHAVQQMPKPAALPAPPLDIPDADVLKGAFSLYKTGKLPWENIELSMYDAAARVNRWHESHWISFEIDVRMAMCRKLEAQKLVEPHREKEISKQIHNTMAGGYKARITELAKKWSVRILFDALMAGGKEVINETD